MAMIVDKAGADGAAIGVDRLRRRAGELADLGDLAVLDPDIRAEARHPGAVDDASVLDQQIIRHRLPPAQPARPPNGRLAELYHAIPRPNRAFPVWIGPEPCKRALLGRLASRGPYQISCPAPAGRRLAKRRRC